MAKGKRLRVIDLWIQALTVSMEDKVIAAALRKQIREVHEFFAEIIRDGQHRGTIHADRDEVAEAWIFVAGGLLATMDSRLGGLLGDDLAARAHRAPALDGRRSPLLARTLPDMEEPRLRHPGLFLVRRGAGWASPKAWLCGPAAPPVCRLWRSPCTRPGVRPWCKVGSLYEPCRVCQVARSSESKVPYLTAKWLIHAPFGGLSLSGDCVWVKRPAC